MPKFRTRLIYAGVAFAAFVIFGFDFEILVGFVLGYLGKSVWIAAAAGAVIASYVAYLAFKASLGWLGVFGVLIGALGVGAVLTAAVYAIVGAGAGWYLGRLARGKKS
jgi:uncharacterized membrane protein